MTFVSYAQNFEDVILWRALKHLKNGRYIDIGAWEPEIDSVSKAFYDHGWRGTHVEPNPFYANRLRLARPDETVIEAVIGSGTAAVEFTVFDDTGLSTGKAEIAAQHLERGFKGRKVLAPQIPLSKVLAACGRNDIHWLKIDVEGMEGEVLKSWGKNGKRPWILVIESTIPSSSVQSFESWEPRVLKLGYEFVYFDGLNRFYLHEKHKDLRMVFGPGPNLFDEFSLGPHSPLVLYHATVAQARSLNAAHEETIRRQAGQVAALGTNLEAAEDNLRAVKSGWSWKLSAPLRAMEQRVRRTTHSVESRPPGVEADLLATMARWPTGRRVHA